MTLNRTGCRRREWV